MKKMISIILSVLMMVSVFGVVTVSASTTSEKSGNSLNCKWSFNEKSGTLTMSGNGKIEKYILRKAFEDYLPDEIAWRQKEQFSDGVGYGWIDTLKMVTSEKVSDEQLKNASFRFPINTPKTKEEYYYRSLFFFFFSGGQEAACVPSAPSVACSTAISLEWHEAF